MNNPSQQPEEPKFDLFATDVEDNLKDELAKGAFQWTDKYTKRLSLLLTATVLVSGGIWYGHYYTNKQITSSVAGAASSLRSAFASGGFAGGGFAGGGAASGASAAGGAGAAAAGGGAGFGGFGGARITGTITKVSGSDVTITLSDPTQASSLKTGDAARVTDTAAAAAAGGAGAPAGAGGFAGGAASGAGTGAVSGAGGTTTRGSGKASGKAGATNGTTSGKAATGGTSAAGGVGAGAAAGGRPAGGFGAGAGAGGGFAAKFSDPQVVACFKQNGVTITAGSPPNFQDPNFRSALTACASVLGITPGAGGAGGGFGGGAGAGGTGTGGFGGGRTRGATPSPTATP